VVWLVAVTSADDKSSADASGSDVLVSGTLTSSRTDPAVQWAAQTSPR